MNGSEHSQRRRIAGFTLIELMVAVAIIGTLASMSGTTYMQYVEKARVARAIVELRGIASSLDASGLDGGDLPDSLAEAGIGNILDPWGSLYYYLRIQGQLPAALSQREQWLRGDPGRHVRREPWSGFRPVSGSNAAYSRS